MTDENTITPFPTKTFNEHGVPVMNHTCLDCGREFSVTPFPDNPSTWLKCAAVDCKSYDPRRDIDLFFLGDWHCAYCYQGMAEECDEWRSFDGNMCCSSECVENYAAER